MITTEQKQMNKWLDLIMAFRQFTKANPELMNELETLTKQTVKQGDLPRQVKALLRAFKTREDMNIFRCALEWIAVALADDDAQVEYEAEELRRLQA